MIVVFFTEINPQRKKSSDRDCVQDVMDDVISECKCVWGACNRIMEELDAKSTPDLIANMVETPVTENITHLNVKNCT